MAALAAGLAAWVLCSGARTDRLDSALVGRGRRATVVSGVRALDGSQIVAIVGALFGAIVVIAGAPILVGVVVLSTFGAARARRRGDELRARQARQRACLSLVEAVAGELRAGRLPRAALSTAIASTLTSASASASARPSQRRGARDDPGNVQAMLGSLGAATELHGDLPTALTAAARLPGAYTLAWLSACWRVSEQRGTGLADAVDRIAVSIRADHEHDMEIRSELAPVRATARLLAVLPVLGVALGHAIGANVIGVLLDTPAGAVLLSAALGLVLLGTLWVDALARSAARDPAPS